MKNWGEGTERKKKREKRSKKEEGATIQGRKKYRGCKNNKDNKDSENKDAGSRELVIVELEDWDEPEEEPAAWKWPGMSEPELEAARNRGKLEWEAVRNEPEKPGEEMEEDEVLWEELERPGPGMEEKAVWNGLESPKPGLEREDVRHGPGWEGKAASVGEGEKKHSKGKYRKRIGKAAAWAAAAAALLLFVLFGLYMALAVYYEDGFSYGTWMNGVYCTGKTVEEVERELLQTCHYDGITVYDGQGGSYVISPEEIGYTFRFREELQKYLDRQDPYLWVKNLASAKSGKLMPAISYEKEKLSAALGRIPDYADPRTEKDRRVEIRKTAAGYILADERKHVLDKDKAMEAVERALLSMETQIDLQEAGCYTDLPYSSEMKEVLERWELIEEFQDCHIVYRFGANEVPVDASVACDWIAVDEDGNFLTDGEGRLLPDDMKIEAFIEALADEYDTLGGVRPFHATRGETVMVKGGIYGNKIDRKAEKEYLKQAFRDRAAEVREPVYLQKGWAEGKNDIGDTYIEVDMTEQMMYYYKDGTLEVETPVVTGNTGRRMGTPEGVNYVYGKARNRVLQGPGYAAHVNFWMPVKGNIGIHDASWRSEYGGEIYKTGGSHGCINTPYDAMSRIYEMAEVGTPVVMFY